MTMGLMAGVFGIYAHAVMPGLRKTDDRTFVAAFQAIDRAIINPLFMLWFFGALVLAATAVALLAGERSVLPWIAVAAVLYLAVVVITIAVNVPLNDAIKAAGRPDDQSRRRPRALRRGPVGGLEQCRASSRRSRSAASPGRSCNTGAPCSASKRGHGAVSC